MKKQIILWVCGLFLAGSFSSCWLHRHHTSVSISDSGKEYELTASYEKRKTRKVLRFLNGRLEEDCGLSFRNSRIDEEITLDDRTRFSLVSYPGELEIRIDKTENSEESYRKIKEICEEVKDLIAEN